jgi:hypothetical protein
MSVTNDLEEWLEWFSSSTVRVDVTSAGAAGAGLCMMGLVLLKISKLTEWTRWTLVASPSLGLRVCSSIVFERSTALAIKSKTSSLMLHELAASDLLSCCDFVLLWERDTKCQGPVRQHKGGMDCRQKSLADRRWWSYLGTAVRAAGFGTFKAEYIGYGHRAIQFVDPDFGIQLGAGVLAKTVDGRRTWNEYPLPETTGQDIPPQTVVFVSRELGWLVGKFIYRTNDGAKTWQALTKTPLGPSQAEPNRQFHPTYADYMPALWFTDSSHGVMARVDGHIYVTNDGGVSWERVLTADRMIRDLVFVDR